MIESGFDTRVLLRAGDTAVTGAELGRLVQRAATDLGTRSGPLVYVGENHPLLPLAPLAAARAGMPFVPVTYRLEDSRLNDLVARQPNATVLSDAATAARIRVADAIVFDDWLQRLPADP